MIKPARMEKKQALRLDEYKGSEIGGLHGYGLIGRPKFIRKIQVFALPQILAFYGALVNILMGITVFPIFGKGADIGGVLPAMSVGIDGENAGFSAVGKGKTVAGYKGVM